MPSTVARERAASQMSRIAVISTGCGLTSMKASCPEASRVRTADSNSTVRRRFRYQYAASRRAASELSPPGASCPVTVEQNAVCGAPGVTGASSSSSRARSADMCGECDA